MEKLTILLNNKPLFEAESFQQASDFLYILNKYRIMSCIGEAGETAIASKDAKTLPKRRKSSKAKGSLSEEQKSVIIDFLKKAAPITEVFAFMNPKDKAERDRIYGYYYSNRKKIANGLGDEAKPEETGFTQRSLE